MRLKLIACLAASMLLAAQAGAAPSVPTFLAVDVNGANYGGGQSEGPTQATFQPWRAFQGFDQFSPDYNPAEDWVLNAATGLTKVFASSEGPITATMYGLGNTDVLARNRGNVTTDAYADLMRDFSAVQLPANSGFGRHYIKLVLSGLVPNQGYEFTGYNKDINFLGETQILSHQAWSDLATLGVDGPAAWMDANVGAGASYQPTQEAPVGYKNPIPTLARALSTGPGSADPWAYSASFFTLADANGIVTVYTWADADSFDGQNVQRATVFNGFEIGIAPEPTSFAMFALGFIGLAGLRRRIG